MDLQLVEFADKIIQFSEKCTCDYTDIRVESHVKNDIIIENGDIENITLKKEQGLGIRVLVDGAWGFCSISNPSSYDNIKNEYEKTVKNARYYSENKKNKTLLYDCPLVEKTINYPVKIIPDTDNIIKVALECDKIIHEQNNIIRSNINPWYSIVSKYFINSEGTKIIQNYTDTVIEMSATAHNNGITQSVNITEGGRGGLEQIKDDEKCQKSAKKISEKASQLVFAKPIKEKKSKVVLNPDFVALLTHEILGHPSEADRVLGKEMAWAGGAWWKGKLGQKIGSEHLNVYDDPTIEKSLGWYQYDDEGIKTNKTNLVQNGILEKHMQSRETAKLFDSTPTGNMRATNYRFMPLIRMACTCISKGDWKQEEMIKEIKDGYLVSNMKIPSIDMKRYNWSISCQYAQKIENGELTDLVRDVIVVGIAPEFFNSIDACGDDFTVRPITNCGKGDPMQQMMMGNGGPSVRAEAIVKSVN
ncbi:MAG: TldD/PmbA family protein [Nitrosopumilaceae archaeon]|nr:TldD/PmbA family protein [Nitrosopumilaceae archaeon]